MTHKKLISQNSNFRKWKSYLWKPWEFRQKKSGFEVSGKEAVTHSSKAWLHRPRPSKHANPPRRTIWALNQPLDLLSRKHHLCFSEVLSGVLVEATEQTEYPSNAHLGATVHAYVCFSFKPILKQPTTSIHCWKHVSTKNLFLNVGLQCDTMHWWWTPHE